MLPLYYYASREAWIAVMKGAICKNASYFNSHRMMRRYRRLTFTIAAALTGGAREDDEAQS